MQNSVEDEYRRLVEEIRNCTKCPLHRFRKNPVPGEGPLDADIMVVGEAPGRNEDLQGRPFVGAAGQLLNKLLELAGLRRDQVYITNVVKCRPPGNRDPRDEEIRACLPYLIRQIKLIKPKIIIALGRHAARTLLELAGLKWQSMSKQHGQVYDADIDGTRLRIIVTYHPAAALYKPPIREQLEKDFGQVISKEVARIRMPDRHIASRQTSILEFLGRGSAR